MDPFSLTVSIITVVTLAAQLVSLGNSYASSISGCAREIEDLVAEVSALSQILIALKKVIDPATATSQTPIIRSGILVGRVEDCANQLKEMITVLTKYQASKNKVKKLMRRLVWPLKEADTREWINKIETYKSTFTLALSADGISVTHAISIDVRELKRGQEKARNQQRLDDTNKRLRDIREWLSPADPRTNYKAARMLQQAGTGIWFTEGIQFKEWFQKDHSFFWIHGISGTGKTILSSIIIDKIVAEAQNQDIILVYFYCDFKEPAKQNAVNLYGSLIAQILEQATEIPGEVNAFYERWNNKPITLHHLKRVFSQLIQRFPKVVIIIDGLDECTDRAEVTEGLLDLKNDPSGNTNVLVTSQNTLATRSAFSGVPNLAMKADNVRVDIELYATNEIERRVKLRRLKPEMKAEITSKLVDGANGMFRWAKCCLDQITMLRNDKAIRQALHSFPSNLDEAYETILTGIQDEDKDFAIRIFQWLVCSARPMTIEEVAEGVSIEIGSTSPDPGNKLNDPEDILDICRGLVSLNEDTRILGLAHFSVKEYLTSGSIAGGPASSYQIQQKTTCIGLAKLCLAYISFDDFDLGPCRADDELKARFEKYPLLEYAAHNWQKHAKSDDKNEDDELSSMIGRFLDPLSSPANFLSWAQAYHTESSEPHRNYNAYQQCSLLISVEIKDYCMPLFSDVLRQPNCGCKAVERLP